MAARGPTEETFRTLVDEVKKSQAALAAFQDEFRRKFDDFLTEQRTVRANQDRKIDDCLSSIRQQSAQSQQSANQLVVEAMRLAHAPRPTHGFAELPPIQAQDQVNGVLIEEDRSKFKFEPAQQPRVPQEGILARDSDDEEMPPARERSVSSSRSSIASSPPAEKPRSAGGRSRVVSQKAKTPVGKSPKAAALPPKEETPKQPPKDASSDEEMPAPKPEAGEISPASSRAASPVSSIGSESPEPAKPAPMDVEEPKRMTVSPASSRSAEPVQDDKLKAAPVAVSPEHSPALSPRHSAPASPEPAKDAVSPSGPPERLSPERNSGQVDAESDDDLLDDLAAELQAVPETQREEAPPAEAPRQAAEGQGAKPKGKGKGGKGVISSKGGKGGESAKGGKGPVDLEPIYEKFSREKGKGRDQVDRIIEFKRSKGVLEMALKHSIVANAAFAKGQGKGPSNTATKGPPKPETAGTMAPQSENEVAKVPSPLKDEPTLRVEPSKAPQSPQAVQSPRAAPQKPHQPSGEVAAPASMSQGKGPGDGKGTGDGKGKGKGGKGEGKGKGNEEMLGKGKRIFHIMSGKGKGKGEIMKTLSSKGMDKGTIAQTFSSKGVPKGEIFKMLEVDGEHRMRESGKGKGKGKGEGKGSKGDKGKGKGALPPPPTTKRPHPDSAEDAPSKKPKSADWMADKFSTEVDHSETRSQQCQYYKHGRCASGQGCQFSHEGERDPAPCMYFMKNRCDAGNNCAYSHELSKFACLYHNIMGRCGNPRCKFHHEPLIGIEDRTRFAIHNREFLLNKRDGTSNRPIESENERRRIEEFVNLLPERMRFTKMQKCNSVPSHPSPGPQDIEVEAPDLAEPYGDDDDEDSASSAGEEFIDD